MKTVTIFTRETCSILGNTQSALRKLTDCKNKFIVGVRNGSFASFSLNLTGNKPIVNAAQTFPGHFSSFGVASPCVCAEVDRDVWE